MDTTLLIAPPKKPRRAYSGKLYVGATVTPETFRRLKELCEKVEISQSELIRRCLALGMEEAWRQLEGR